MSSAYRKKTGKIERLRLDELLVARKLAVSRIMGQRLILAGEVRVGGQLESKPHHTFPVDAPIEMLVKPRFVGRGGDKLQGALDAFGASAKDLACLDVGASTGGFTDCLLQNGAARVYAADVGKGLISQRLREDPRVVVMEEVNARYMTPSSLPETVGLAVVDVSFISLTKILPGVTKVLAPGGRIISLIKPQFEAGRNDVSRGGVVRDPAVRERVIEAIRAFGTGTLGLEWLGLCESPLLGPAGNVEFFAYWRKGEGSHAETRITRGWGTI